jgi:hypothetical protein
VELSVSSDSKMATGTGVETGNTYLEGFIGTFESYSFDGLDCYDNRTTYDVVGFTGMDVVPTVSIQAFTAVGKEQTRTVQVTLNPSPSNAPITLTIEKASGTGDAVFTSNNSKSLTISSSAPVEIKGITESSTANNLILKAKSGDTLLASETFTVLLVTLSLRTGIDMSVSADNSARSAYIAAMGRDGLGNFFSTGTGPNAAPQQWVTAAEVVGTVTPSNYTGTVVLIRKVLGYYIYSDRFQIETGGGYTESTPTFQDSDPQSGGSSGKVYDLDAPGISLRASSNPVGAIARVRTNFLEWATVDDGIRVSVDLEWFSRLSVQKTLLGDVRNSDVTGDNTAGTGLSKLTWNLQ